MPTTKNQPEQPTMNIHFARALFGNDIKLNDLTIDHHTTTEHIGPDTNPTLIRIHATKGKETLRQYLYPVVMYENNIPTVRVLSGGEIDTINREYMKLAHETEPYPDVEIAGTLTPNLFNAVLQDDEKELMKALDTRRNHITPGHIKLDRTTNKYKLTLTTLITLALAALITLINGLDLIAGALFLLTATGFYLLYAPTTKTTPHTTPKTTNAA